MFKNFFSPRKFADEQERKSTVRTLIVIIVVSLLGAIFSLLAALLTKNIQGVVIMSGLALLLLLSVYLTWRGILLPAQFLTPTALFATITYLVIRGNGLHDASFLGYAGVIIVASLTLGQGAAFVFAGMAIATTWIIGIGELNGSFVNPGSVLTDQSTPVFTTILILAITFTQKTLIDRMIENLQRARLNEQKQIEANQNLIGLQESLEKRVEDRTAELKQRTADLEGVNAQIRRRASQFEALAQVTQAITAIRDLHELLPRITSVISERFGFYHVGIFLLDEISQYAILSAANSEGGKKMIERKHRLRVGEEGIVGYATATGKPRIALDVGKDAVYFNNIELPDTHSEVALPLIIKNIIVGALDVQSKEASAFSAEDIRMLSLLADQVSLAIENARLFDDARKALAESEMISRSAVHEAWARLPEEQKLIGYRYNISGATPLRKPISIADVKSEELNGAEKQSGITVVPIAIRGESIGNLVIQSASGDKWTDDQLDLIKAVAERVALSAENARLFEETTARAERERLVSEITGRIRNQADPQEMIRTAIEELRGALGASRVEVIPQSAKSIGKSEA